MARRYEAVCDGGHQFVTTDSDDLCDWLLAHKGCRPPYRCTGCGLEAVVLVADSGLCVRCDIDNEPRMRRAA